MEKEISEAMLRLSLQFFAEAGDAGDGAVGDGQDDAADGTEDITEDDELDAYDEEGEGQEDAEGDADDEPEAGTLTEDEEYAQFCTRFADRIKAESDAKTRNVVERRLKNTKDLTAKVAEHYGLAANDYAGMIAALDGDTDAIEVRAARAGRTVEDQKFIERAEAREREEAIAKEEAQAAEAYETILAQSRECKAKYPDFSLEELEANERAVRLLSTREMSVTEVYETINRDKLTQAAVNEAADKSARKVMGQVRSNRSRPTEGSMSGGRAPVTEVTAEMLTDDVMDAIDRYQHIHGTCSEAEMLTIINRMSGRRR